VGVGDVEEDDCVGVGVGVVVDGIVGVCVGVCCAGDVWVAVGSVVGLVVGGSVEGPGPLADDGASLGGALGCGALMLPVLPVWGALGLPDANEDGAPLGLAPGSCG
jgi:hypothetical protein